MYDVRSRYVASAVATVGPEKLLTMLYDRLLVDVDRAEAALRQGERIDGRTHLTHAQEIVSELIASLDVDAWDGGPRLFSIYTYLLSELIETSMTSDADRAIACRNIIAPLREAWHGASASLSTIPTQRPAPSGENLGTEGFLGVG